MISQTDKAAGGFLRPLSTIVLSMVALRKREECFKVVHAAAPDKACIFDDENPINVASCFSACQNADPFQS